jgi:hypothetical protein
MDFCSIIAGLTACFLILAPPAAADSRPPSAEAVMVTAEYSLPVQGGEAGEIDRALALYGAKARAVAMGGKYLSHRGLVGHFGERQKEILCLAADEIEPLVLEERFIPESETYYIRIQAAITPTDFVRGQNADLALEEKEKSLSYREEMEQPVLSEIAPGKELSRAYRYLRKQQWRIAVIYLDHLQQKYPGWSEVYFAKAIGYYSLNQSAKMTDALETACRLNNQEACNDLRGLGLTKSHGTAEN